MGAATRGGVTAGNVGVTPGAGSDALGGVGVATLGAGATAHPTSHSQTSAKLQWRNRCRNPTMWLILLEAALAVALLVFIVWWTMFDKPKKKD
jgi:hypothetical protein